MTTVSTLPLRLALVLSLLVTLVAPGGAVAAPAESLERVRVVVQADDLDVAAALVVDHGGVVENRLPLIGAVAATVPPAVADRLATQDGITVTPDVVVDFASTTLPDAPPGDLQLQAMNPPANWSPDTGSGVGVALIDTGVADVPGLADRVIRAKDYSVEGDGIDRYGHGTFMAGLIAADGSSSSTSTPLYGVAPGAHIVSVKVAGADGVTHLSTLLDAIGWVVVNQDTYGIRVLSLSVAVSLPMAPVADPLAQAVEAAWASGITVVVAAGNDGTDGVSSPGHSPWVVTVGSTDTQGTVPVADDTLASWSSRGKVMGRHKPDVLAPGVSTISLRAPGSFVDEGFPEGRVGEEHFRGSGTSMSTALTAGAAAALLELRPFATPDDVKAALVTTGQDVPGSTAGAVDLAAADAIAPTGDWRQRHPTATRGPDGRKLRAMPWNERGAASPSDTWERLRWVEGDWERLRWVDGEWQRLRWVDDDWARLRWVQDDWARLRWVDANLARLRWVDADFSRLRWVDGDWARARWVQSEWSRLRWVGDDWSRLRWVDAGWTASNWSSMSAP
jgi:serine protease AprX